MRIVALCFLAACHTSATAPTVKIAWEPPRDLALGGGERGPWKQNDSRFDHVDDPSVVLTSSGDVNVVWVDHRTKDVYFQIVAPDGAARHPRPINVSRTPAVFSWLPRIAVTGDHVHVLWQEIVFSGGSHGGDIFYARSHDRGVTFGTPRNLSSSIGGDGKGRIDRNTWNNGSLDLVLGASGTLYAAWTEFEGRLWFTRSIDAGNTFELPQLVHDDRQRPARAPSIAAGANSIHLAWTTGEDARADIHVATSRDAGVTFAAPILVSPSREYSDAPKLALDPAGTLHLAYAESDAGPFGRYDIRYARSRDGGKSFEPARVISRPRPADTISAAFPSLAVTDSAVHVIWELYPGDTGIPHGLAHVTSSDAGTRFSEPKHVPGSTDPLGGGNGSFQGRLMRKLAVANDMIAIVNSSLTVGRSSRVWLVRGQLVRG